VQSTLTGTLTGWKIKPDTDGTFLIAVIHETRPGLLRGDRRLRSGDRDRRRGQRLRGQPAGAGGRHGRAAVDDERAHQHDVGDPNALLAWGSSLVVGGGVTPTLGFSNLVMAFQFTVDTVDPPAPTERQPVAIGVTAQSSQGAGALGPKVRRGDVIGLTGANMDLATSVYFDSIPAKIWWIDGFDHVTVVVPDGLPDGPVIARVGGIAGVTGDTRGHQVDVVR